MSELTLDLETSTKNVGEEAVGTMKANPFHRENKIVAHGVNIFGSTMTSYKQTPPYDQLLPHADTLVAHNMSFDLKYLLRDHNELFMDWLKTGKLWCTMLAEYLLTGQQETFPSLDHCSIKYGGTIKDELIKEYWNEGIDTEDIPEEELIEYLVHDVDNTRLVYEGQLKKAEELGMLNLIELHMESLIAIIIMEFNGLKFDLEFAKKESARLTIEQDANEELLISLMKDYFDEAVWDKINPDSGDQLSCILFGGNYTNKEPRPVVDLETGKEVIIKSGPNKGKVKTKLNDIVRETRGFGAIPKTEWELKKKGFYGTGEDNIRELVKLHRDNLPLLEFLNCILKNRALSKDNGTYYKGYSKLVHTDGYIHHSLNTVITATGRLSSSKPNCQNLTN